METITTAEVNQNCKFCGSPRQGNFCHQCGQRFDIYRLTLKSIFHEVFHFFTHFDHGFPFTLKRLINSPGKMQKEYVEGIRDKYQKPFSMFFICASFAALALYLINEAVVNYYDAGDSKEAIFFHKYWVLLQVCMLPIYALITYLVYRSSQYNFAEIIILQLYTFSFLFLVLTVVHLFKFIAPHLQTRYIELPVLSLYGIVTNINFFKKASRLNVILKSVVVIAIIFLLATYTQDLLVNKFM